MPRKSLPPPTLPEYEIARKYRTTASTAGTLAAEYGVKLTAIMEILNAYLSADTVRDLRNYKLSRKLSKVKLAYWGTNRPPTSD